MDFLSAVAKSVSNTAKIAFKKSSDIVENTKLNFAVASEENNIEKSYEDIGKLVYQKYNEGEVISNEILDLCEMIDESVAKVRSINRKINDLQNKNFCRRCGSPIDKTTNKCEKCGF